MTQLRRDCLDNRCATGACGKHVDAALTLAVGDDVSGIVKQRHPAVAERLSDGKTRRVGGHRCRQAGYNRPQLVGAGDATTRADREVRRIAVRVNAELAAPLHIADPTVGGIATGANGDLEWAFCGTQPLVHFEHDENRWHVDVVAVGSGVAEPIDLAADEDRRRIRDLLFQGPQRA